MTISYNLSTLNARLQAVVTNVDAGPGNGQMRFLGSGSTTIAIVTLQKPSGTVSGGILTFSGLPLGGATLASASVVLADVEDSNGNVVASGLTVGPSTTYDIYMASNAVMSGQTLSVTYATITGR